MNDITIIFIVLAVLGAIGAGVLLFIRADQAPVGGTLLDKAVSPGIKRGPPFFRAIKVKDAKTCQEEFGKNSFWSAEGDACYTCPPGNLVNAFGDMKKNKCTDTSKTIFDPKRDSGATFRRKGLGPAGLSAPEKGEFFEGNAIWKCPPNTIRDILLGPTSCIGECNIFYPEIPDYKQGSKIMLGKKVYTESAEAFAERLKHVSNLEYRQRTNESNEDFMKRLQNGIATRFEPTPPQPNLQAAKFDIIRKSCWSCPGGYHRSTTEIDSPNACSQ